MRVGVTLNDEKGLESNVCAHFGQCSHFLIADIKDGKISETKVVKNNAEHSGGCMAVDEILKYNITHIISGGMGMGAQKKFKNAGVKIFGYNGNVKTAIEKLIKNDLGSLDICKEHKECN